MITLDSEQIATGEIIDLLVMNNKIIFVHHKDGKHSIILGVKDLIKFMNGDESIANWSTDDEERLSNMLKLMNKLEDIVEEYINDIRPVESTAS